MGCWGLKPWRRCSKKTLVFLRTFLLGMRGFRKINKGVLYGCCMAKRGKRWRKVGRWAFLIGVVLAIVFALVGRMTPDVVAVLIAIGFIVGLLSVSEEEAQPFLMSGAVLIIASAFGQNALLAFGVLERMFSALLVIFVPATIVVAVRNVFGIATS